MNKKIIALLLNIHVDEWYLILDSLTTPMNIDDEMKSPKKRSLLLTIIYVYERIDILPFSKRKLFNHSEEEYRKIRCKF